jgi:hypothetical protein
MTDSELRSKLLARLERIASRLPNGLLHRLVEDAQFFYDWNLCKKGARKSSRIAQVKLNEAKAEANYWRSMRNRIG